MNAEIPSTDDYANPFSKPPGIEWLEQAARSRAFGPTTTALLTPYVNEIKRLRRIQEAAQAVDQAVMASHLHTDWFTPLATLHNALEESL